MNTCPKILQLRLRGKYRNSFPNTKLVFLLIENTSWLLYHSTPPYLHVYGLPNIHKQDIPLRTMVNSLVSPSYALAGFLHEILSPLEWKLESFIKNSGHFIQLLKSVNLQSLATLVSFDTVSIFTNVLADKDLQVIRNKLHNDGTLAELSVLQVEATMELLEVCLRTT
jgi:hypothetical protein